mmetsp:Transcript_44784/g.142680  ORF Transcript_44784/g.142680 Transcript_44784/m.142680 type:complete len:275 (+) Transcript_44784:134-958(+)
MSSCSFSLGRAIACCTRRLAVRESSNELVRSLSPLPENAIACCTRRLRRARAFLLHPLREHESHSLAVRESSSFKNGELQHSADNARVLRAGVHNSRVCSQGPHHSSGDQAPIATGRVPGHVPLRLLLCLFQLLLPPIFPLLSLPLCLFERPLPPLLPLLFFPPHLFERLLQLIRPFLFQLLLAAQLLLACPLLGLHCLPPFRLLLTQLSLRVKALCDASEPFSSIFEVCIRVSSVPMEKHYLRDYVMHGLGTLILVELRRCVDRYNTIANVCD